MIFGSIYIGFEWQKEVALWHIQFHKAQYVNWSNPFDTKRFEINLQSDRMKAWNPNLVWRGGKRV